MEAGGSGVQDYPRLHVMLEAILLCVKPYLNKPKQTNKKSQRNPLLYMGDKEAQMLSDWEHGS